jgi:hypothetical protein
MTPSGPRTVASDAIAAGEPALASSFRFHRPRGPVCGQGYCCQCEIVTPEGRKLACQTPAGTDGVRGRRRLLRPLGRIAELFPPWFYERRFLRPRGLRRLSLHTLRYLSGAGSLAAHAVPAGVRAYEQMRCETVLVGSSDAHPNAFAVDLDAGDLALGVYPGKTLGVLRDGTMTAVAFERLVLATGSYERLPPIPGNDLPGVVGLRAAETYARAGALREGSRLAVWAPADERERVEALVERHGLSLVWLSAEAPTAIVGRRRVEAVVAGDRVPCDLFVVGVRQPAIELALQAGATAELTSDGLPILVLRDVPEWLEVVGGAAARTSGVPDVVPADAAVACACEDVRVSDLKACVAQGFAHPELVKRRTGAMTGPCQGKMCAATVLGVLRDAGVDPVPTRSRPLARPVTLAELAADA